MSKTSYFDDIKKDAYEVVANCHKYNAILKVSISAGQKYGYLYTNPYYKEIITMENIIKYVREVSNVFVSEHPLDACNFFKTEYDYEKVYIEAQEIYEKLLDFDTSVSEYIKIGQRERSLTDIICENAILDIQAEMNSSFMSYVNSAYNTSIIKSKIKTPNRKLTVKWSFDNTPDLTQGRIR